MSSTPSLNSDSNTMNELRMKALLQRFKALVEELETEIKSDPGSYVKYDQLLHDQIKMYEEYDDDDGYPD